MSTAPFRTRLTELFGIRHPLLLGGMHHLGESGVVAAVVNAGAMGFITARSFATPDALRQDLRRCRQLTGGRPFGVNLTLARRAGHNDAVQDWIRIALDEGVRHFESAGNSPAELVGPIQRGGGVLIHKCPSVRHALSDSAWTRWRWSGWRKADIRARTSCRPSSTAPSRSTASGCHW